jgi:integrase/recombinase XerC
LGELARHLDTLGIREACAVLPEHIGSFARAQRRRQLATSTRAQSLSAAARFFGELVERGELLLDPAGALARAVRRHSVLPHVPTRAQISRLLAAAPRRRHTGVRDRAIIELLYGSALRVGELVGLELGDVDFALRLVRIRRGKGARERVVPLGGPAAAWLTRYLAEMRARWTRGRPRTASLLVTNRGAPMDSWAVRAVLLATCRRAHLGRIGPHALRHAAATHMLAAGADLRHVQMLLGHADAATTQVYTRVEPTEVKAMHRRTHPREVQP